MNANHANSENPGAQICPSKLYNTGKTFISLLRANKPDESTL